MGITDTPGGGGGGGSGGNLISTSVIIGGGYTDCIWEGDVSSDGTPITTSIVLKNGQRYSILASEIFSPDTTVIDKQGRRRVYADAQFYKEYNGETWVKPVDSNNVVQSFLQINGQSIHWGDVPTLEPNNYEYVTEFIGKGAPITFRIKDWYDNDYSNNWCHLPVCIKESHNPPVIKAKWEIDNLDNLESADPYHTNAGSQFLPPITYDTTKSIAYLAIVTDEEDGGDVLSVSADVYHPCPADNADPSINAQFQVDGGFKYEVGMFNPLVNQPINPDTTIEILGADVKVLSFIQRSCSAGIVKFNEGYDCEELIFELREGSASLWVGMENIHYHQPAGHYFVGVRAIDNDDQESWLYNWFYYYPVAAFEPDFEAVDYGSVSMQRWKQVNGDFIFRDGDGKPTVRSIGNFPVVLGIKQDDMGLGYQQVVGNRIWNVKYKAGLNYPDIFPRTPEYVPFQWQGIPGVLWRCNTMKMDFYIYILKGTGIRSGEIQLEGRMADFLIKGPSDDPIGRENDGTCMGL